MRVKLDAVRGRAAPETLFLDAPTLEDACDEARRMGYQVLAVRGGWSSSGPGKPGLNVVVFVEQLRDLLVAGLSVIEALTTLRAGQSAVDASQIDALATELRSGRRLSEALESRSSFPILLVGLVRAAELTSNLPEALSRYLDHQRRVAELRHRVTSVAIYPLLVTGVGVLVLLFLAFYVMPRFARVFEGMTGELPWSAKAMVVWGHWLKSYGPTTTVMLVLVGALFLFGALSRRTRRIALNGVLETAPFRRRLRVYFLARWYRATGMLVEGGIPLAQALPIAASLLPQSMGASAVSTERGISDGLSPSQAFALAGMTTPVAEQLLRAGEKTGDLGAVLTRIAQFHEAEITRSLERAMRALEPIVMTLVGVGVGAIVVLMYLPIFELASALQ